MNDVLQDSLFRITSKSRLAPEQMTLPEILARLSTGEIESFGALQVHQQQPWHAFLVQLAALALARAKRTEPWSSASEWTKQLLALTDGVGDAWRLVVPDLARPGFFQPPVPEENLAGFKNLARTPDALDVLQTAKNHDVKGRRMAHARAEHWVYALVSLQTMQGFSGRGNYGIARMNGGFSNRSMVGFVPGSKLGERFRRDLAIHIEARDAICDGVEYQSTGGIGLLWLEPWDGKTSLAISDCDPFFIEVCRRVRLTGDDGPVQARFTATTAARLHAADLSGNTGDVWTPVVKQDAKALTVSGRGFTYKLTRELLLGRGDEMRYILSQASRLRKDESPDLRFSATALVRGQGITEGFHHREVPVPPKVQRRLRKPDESERLSRRAVQRVADADVARTKVLKPALCALLQGGPDKIDFKDDRVFVWLDRFEQAIDDRFFEALWADLDRPDLEAMTRWHNRLFKAARQELDFAIESAPIPHGRRYRAISAATGIFHGAARKQFHDIFPDDAKPRSQGDASNA